MHPMLVCAIPLLVLALAGGASGGGAGAGILPGISNSKAGDDGQRAEQVFCCIVHGLGARQRPLKPLGLRGGFGIRDQGVEIFDPNDSDSVSTLEKRGEGWNLIEEDFFPRDESAAERDGYEYVTDSSEELAKVSIAVIPRCNWCIIHPHDSHLVRIEPLSPSLPLLLCLCASLTHSPTLPRCLSLPPSLPPSPPLPPSLPPSHCLSFSSSPSPSQSLRLSAHLPVTLIRLLPFLTLCRPSRGGQAISLKSLAVE